MALRQRRSTGYSHTLCRQRLQCCHIEVLESRALLSHLLEAASVDLVTGNDVTILVESGNLVVREGSTQLFRKPIDDLSSLTITASVGSEVTVLNAANPVSIPMTFIGSRFRDVFNGELATGPLQIHGGGGDDRLTGGLDDDTISGGAGQDVIFGGPGVGDLTRNNGRNDVLTGGTGNDTVFGQGGADYLGGNEGRDILKGGGGSGDTLSGGPGADLLFGGPGNDIVGEAVGSSRIVLTDTALIHGAELDSLAEIEVAQISIAGVGIEFDATGFSGRTEIVGSPGPDTLLGGSGKDFFNGGPGDDLIEGNEGDDVIFGHSGNDIIRAGAGRDRVFGSTGDDLIDGGAGSDTILGQRGNDTVLSNSGDDVASGGLGDDEYAFGSAFPLSEPRTADLIQGSDQEIFYQLSPGVSERNSVIGFQTLRFHPSGSTGVRFTFGGLSDVVVIGSPGNDTILSGGGQDSLVGLAGNDILRGRAGHDTLLGGAGHDFLAGDDTELGAGNDVLRGGGSNDEIHGGFGVDNADGNGGFDILFEQIEGSVSTYIGNTLVVDGVGTPARNFEAANLHAEGSGPVSIDTSGYAGEASLIGTAAADVLVTGSGDDLLNGAGGDDTLMGGAGDDLLSGRAGILNVDGGPGTDHFNWGRGPGAPDIATLTLTDSLFSVDGVSAPATGLETASLGTNGSSEGAAVVVDTTGFSGNVRVFGGFGADTIRTGPGDDRIDAGLGNDLLIGGAGDDMLNAGGGDDTLRGDAGVDILNGEAGADRLEHDGNDVLVSDADDVIVEVMAAMMGP